MLKLIYENKITETYLNYDTDPLKSVQKSSMHNIIHTNFKSAYS